MKTGFYLFLITVLVSSYPFTDSNGQSGQLPADVTDYPYWIEMMQDPDANYYNTVEAFNLYWADRPVRKASGYNPFKRWEWYMKFKINPDGSKRVSGEDREAYLRYVHAHDATRDFNGDWINLGPIELPASPNEFWGNGRLNAIAFHPTDPDIIFVGAPSGGLWKSDDGGETWATLTDNQPTLGVSSIIVDYSDPDVIYLGSGDRDAGDAEGLGVFKSTDGGLSWTQINTNMGSRTVGRMVQHPSDASLIFAATSGGIYKTTDGGNSWAFKQSGNIKEIVMKPGNPSVLYASGSGDFYRSTDGGENWALITSGLPGGAYRGVIAVSPANPEYVYFLASTSQAFYGLYLSTDGGQSFTQQSSSPNILGWSCNGGSGGQAWYDLDIAADPLNEDVIYAGGINCWKSIDAGQTWFMVSNQVGDCGAWPAHADLHVLEYSPLNGNLYAGNDGGIWWTDNGGSTWTRITNGLAIGQQYKLGQSKLLSYHTITGYQDNGISTYHGDQWIQTDMYADGMECQMDNTDTTLSYGCMQYGRMYRYVDDKVTDLIAGEGINGIDESGAWVTPFTQHEIKQNVMFIGYTNLWRTENLTETDPAWTKISDGIGGASSIVVVEHSPADTSLFYFIKSNGRVIRSDNIMDENPDYIEITSSLPFSATPTDLEAHPTQADVLYLTQNRKVFKSTDRGLNWEDISGTLPNVSVNDIAYYDRGPHDALYVGTNMGVFFRDNTLDDWVMFSAGLPAAILVTEIEIFHHPEDQTQDKIRASSYGRGLWESVPYYGELIPDFYASDSIISAGCAIDFFDMSCGYPDSWQWTFDGATPAAASGPNPAGVVYPAPGDYFVKLVVSNPEDNDSITKMEYITVGEAVQPTAGFMAEDTVVCPSFPVQFYDMSEDCPTEWEWEFDPPTVSFSGGTNAQSQNPMVEMLETGSYDVTLTASNATGSSTFTREGYIEAGGYPLPFIEDFEAPAFGSMEWYVTNPDGSNSWENHYNESMDNHAMRMMNWGYFNLDERDQLVSPPINIDGFGGEGYLFFEHAYAQRFSEADSLVVYISDDCGTTWTRVFEAGPDGSGSFATAANTGLSFEPQSTDDWCGSGWGAECFAIDISAWADAGTIRIMFENYNGFGNNIYIDNVIVDFAFGLQDEAAGRDQMSIFPNPNQGEFRVVLKEEFNGGILKIFDMKGTEILSRDVAHGENVINLSMDNARKGLFLVQLISGNVLESEKVIIR